jgi:hypothetical protein
MTSKMIIFCIILFEAAGLAQAFPDQDDPGMETVSRPATTKEVDEIQGYARGLGREWISKLLGLDLFAMEQDFKRRTQALTSVTHEGGKPSIGGIEAAYTQPAYVLHLDFEQYDDINRIRQDPWDIPFAFKLNAQSVLIRGLVDLKTEAFVPLSWKDELRVKAELPVRLDRAAWLKRSLHAAGFTSPWAVRMMWGNRLGQNLLELGAGTQWLNCWDIKWIIRQRFGQGLSENSQWLKLGLIF